MAAKKDDVIIDSGAVYVLRAGTPVYVKTADICAMTGKSNQWIGQLISQGTLNKRSTPHGALFDVTASIRSYCNALENRADSQKEKANSAAEKEKNDAEISIKKAKAIITVLEAKELQGKMHRSEDVAAMTEDLIYSIRGMLVALPGRLAVDVVASTNAAEAAEIIRKEVSKVMREISNYRYDPKKYEERVRERRDWETVSGRDADDD
ncbi:MAG TPA: hypothetical protein VN626_02805 [Clostridia bacterium]|nr:hypothetical protein [Clostridia bacterium]